MRLSQNFKQFLFARETLVPNGHQSNDKQFLVDFHICAMYLKCSGELREEHSQNSFFLFVLSVITFVLPR